MSHYHKGFQNFTSFKFDLSHHFAGVVLAPEGISNFSLYDIGACSAQGELL